MVLCLKDVLAEQVDLKFSQVDLVRQFVIIFVELQCPREEGSWQALADTVTITASSSHNEHYLPDNIRLEAGKPWHDDTGNNAWLMFNFTSPVTINGFRTKAPTNWPRSAFKSYRFEQSGDGESWVIVKSGEGADLSCCEWQEIMLCETSSQYFRLYMLDTWQYSYFTINQLEFHVNQNVEKRSKTRFYFILITFFAVFLHFVSYVFQSM